MRWPPHHSEYEEGDGFGDEEGAYCSELGCMNKAAYHYRTNGGQRFLCKEHYRG